MENLIFFDKEGKSLNFNYEPDLERYEGDILFHENSSDTFKTQAIYMFEKIPAFEYACPNDLTLKKWQLFNEHGFKFYRSTFTDQVINRIEPVNFESDYFSKWIYGDDFHKKFPKGTIVRVNDPIFSLNSVNRTYMVIRTKPGAIMILTDEANLDFDNNWNWQLPTSYNNETISSLDIIGINNYITPTLQNTLSSWNETDFYLNLYENKKLNIVNTDNNDDYKETLDFDDVEVVTVKKTDNFDISNYEYTLDASALPSNTDLLIEVLTRTDVPLIYEAGLQFYDGSTPNLLGFTNVIDFTSGVPRILKPGTEFKIPESNFNQQFYRVSNIPNFLGNANQVTYQFGQQVIWENKIYQCIQSYTWVANETLDDLTTTPPTISTDPSDINYWTDTPNYILVDQTPTNETIVSSKVYLTQDRFVFRQSFTFSQSVTLASAVERYSEQLSVFDVDMGFDNDVITSRLIYPSQYVILNYLTDTQPQVNIGQQNLIIEKPIEIEEKLQREFNFDISENFNYNIVFTDMDEFGLIITINGEVYQSDIVFIYSSAQIDMERTIDATLRRWFTLNSAELILLGIIPSLQTIDSISPYFNSINLRTQYPNVPLDFVIEVGSTADYYIEHSQVTFFEPSIEGVTFSFSPYLDIRINGTSYPVTHSLPDPNSNLPQTLQNWINEYQFILDDFGIFVNNVGSTLKFNLKEYDRRCDLEIRPNAQVLPGDKNFEITYKFSGNHGSLLTSNEILLATQSGTASGTQSCEHFEATGFATGMITGINNTIYPLQNVDYNIIFLDPYVMNLSYEGPFWGLTQSCDTNSPFAIVGFSNGFQETGCITITQSNSGMFNNQQFSNAYSISFQNTTTYSVNTYNTGTQSMVDIIYVQPTNSMFCLSGDLQIFNSINGSLETTIPLSGTTSPLKLMFNQFDSYVYALKERSLHWIDPYTQYPVGDITLPEDAFSMDFNRNNGDVYITTDSNIRIYQSGTLVQTISGQGYDLAFNDFEGDMYIASPPSTMRRVDGDTRTVVGTYLVPAITDDEVIYDPVNESIFFFDTSFLYKIDNNTLTQLTSNPSGTDNYIAFSSLDSSVFTSTDSPRFAKYDIINDQFSFNNTAPSAYGFETVNYYDGDIYISNQDPLSPNISVMNSQIGTIREVFPLSFGDNVTRAAFDGDRNSVWFLQPTQQQIIEIVPQVSFVISPIVIGPSITITQSQYGTLAPDYLDRDHLWLNTRDYLRRPRMNFNGGVTASLYFRWFSDNVPQFFYYDFSGDQLTTQGPLAYQGERPLPEVVLNRRPNRDITKVNDPKAQQTVFQALVHQLSFIDDDDDISTQPEPIETFIGFNSTVEGPLRSIAQLFVAEPIDFTLNTKEDVTNKISFRTETDPVTSERRGIIELDVLSNQLFTTDINGNERGLRSGQHIAIFINDVSNSTSQYISQNNGYLLKVKAVFPRQLVVEFFKDIDFLEEESTIVENYPDQNDTTYLSVRFRVWDREIGRFITYAQTEIEDERYKIELNNIGKLISSDDVYIFKSYDIKEEGIDWTFLNKKRKEMLMMRHMIYPYIGSYKAIINAINYFGYNDLELYEYYRNVNQLSKNYLKLFKVEIPDIFDPNVEGWTDNDFLKGTFPNQNYEETKLFNLTYRITDREGNNLLTYSLEEVQKKLQGLKEWLENNVIPLTHKILDITGRADFLHTSSISHITRDVSIFNVHESMTPITHRMNEAYLMPVNNGSTVYNCVLDLYTQRDTGLPDQYTIDIRTYEIYREWYPMKTYNAGDRVYYFDKVYESTIDNNKLNNPRKYESVNDWQQGTTYNVSDIVRYDRDFYIFSGYGMTPSMTASVIPPSLDNNGPQNNWIDITEWRQIDLSPIQRLSETRRSGNLLPFNFTLDSNIDPFVVVEITSENGYGSTYRDKKNYDIKGILDIEELEAFSNLTSKQYRSATQITRYLN